MVSIIISENYGSLLAYGMKGKRNPDVGCSMLWHGRSADVPAVCHKYVLWYLDWARMSCGCCGDLVWQSGVTQWDSGLAWWLGDATACDAVERDRGGSADGERLTGRIPKGDRYIVVACKQGIFLFCYTRQECRVSSELIPPRNGENRHGIAAADGVRLVG